MPASAYIESLFALIFIIGLILLLGKVLPMLAPRLYGLPMKKTGKNDRRLYLTESIQLDPKRRLVLMEHDNQEHLILLGMNDEKVISSTPKKSKKGPKK